MQRGFRNFRIRTPLLLLAAYYTGQLIQQCIQRAYYVLGLYQVLDNEKVSKTENHIHNFPLMKNKQASKYLLS